MSSDHSHHHGRNYHWILAIFPLGLALYFASLMPQVAAGNYPSPNLPWVDGLDIRLSFYVDGLALLLALLVTGMGALIYVYASGYLAGDRHINRFYVIITLFMLAMLGLVVADNIFLVFIFWELTSISSYLLIGYNHESAVSQRSALQALLVTGGGGMCLMAGLVLLGVMGGSWELSELLQQKAAVYTAHPFYVAAVILILLGCFTKSAQFPFHFWLPNAMAAPTPVSAYLHSATMVKAGVYLLARLNPMLSGSDLWFYTLVVFGGFTGLLGAWLSWQRRDLKRIMAYSTISALGTLVFLIGLGTSIALKAAVTFLLVHSLYKGALFMAAGAIDHGTGTRDVTRLSGLARSMPYTFVGVVLAAVSMAGLPPMLGFVGKELIYEAAVEWENGTGAALLATVALLTNVLMVTAAAIVSIVPFFKLSNSAEGDIHGHRAPRTMWLGPIVLGLLALLAGLFVGSAFVSGAIIEPAATAVAGKPVAVDLYLFPAYLALFDHGRPTPLLLSLVTVLAGVALFLGHGRLRERAQRLDAAVSRFGPERAFEAGLEGVLKLADFQTWVIQNGYLRYYLQYVALTLVVLVGGTLAQQLGGWELPVFEARLYEVLIALVIVAAVVMLILVRSRLAAVAALGVVGYGIAIMYVFFSAPDLAMTQFSIETLTVILYVLVLYRLPRFVTLTDTPSRLRDGAIAISVGVVMAGMVLAAAAVRPYKHVTEYYALNSYLKAKGHNVVNVILVDFRGFDTLIEITVLSVAALGVYALIRGAQLTRKDSADD